MRIKILIGIGGLVLSLMSPAVVMADFQLSTVEQKGGSVTFEDADILKFELTNRDDESYDKEIISTFSVNNISDKPVNYYSADFSYYDENGNEICHDGRYNDCQVMPGTTSRMKSYSDLDGKEKSVIASIEVAEYKYTMDGMTYEVNLQTNSVDSWVVKDKSNTNFKEANIIDFTLNGIGIVSGGSYEVEVQINNKGKIPVSYVSYRMGYFDAEGNYLDNDGRYCDSLINVDTYATSKSFCTDETVAGNVAAVGVYEYRYTLTEPDANGFNSYEINLQTNTVEGRLKED